MNHQRKGLRKGYNPCGLLISLYLTKYHRREHRAPWGLGLRRNEKPNQFSTLSLSLSLPLSPLFKEKSTREIYSKFFFQAAPLWCTKGLSLSLEGRRSKFEESLGWKFRLEKTHRRSEWSKGGVRGVFETISPHHLVLCLLEVCLCFKLQCTTIPEVFLRKEVESGYFCFL